MNEVFFLLEARLRLYPTKLKAVGKTMVEVADIDHPVWMGACAGKMRIQSKWQVVETFPTGSAYGRKHPLIDSFQVSIERVWVLPLEDLNDPVASLRDLIDFAPEPRRYVLDVLWESEDSFDWQRRTFYGVTIAERNLDSNEVFEFSDGQVFDAEFYTPSSARGNVSEAPVDVLPPVPMVVRWRGNDGELWLYNYDPVGFGFTETTAGISAGRATITNVPGGGGSWNVLWDPDASPLPNLQADGTFNSGPLVEGPPSNADLPRLDFYYGNTRWASIGRDGTIFAPAFYEYSEELGLVTPAFNILGGTKHWLRIDATGVSFIGQLQAIVVSVLGDDGSGFQLGDGGVGLSG